VAEEPVSDDDGGSGPDGVVARARGRAEALAEGAREWLDTRRTEAMPVDLAVGFYERDRDAFASVLGAAIALRLFLFFVPAMLFVSAVVMLVAGSDGVRSIAEQAGVTGSLADQVGDVSQTDTATRVWLLLVTAWLTVWAGRTLTKVLAACSAGAWGMAGRQGRATLRMAAAVTTLVFLLVVTAAVINRLEKTQGIAVMTTSWVVAGVVYAVAWFLVSASLPRRTTDPGALLPGAALVGASLALMQWFLQFYLPGRVDRSTELAGSIGTSVAVLGIMFLVGRLLAMSLILDAVVYDRLGSISELVFALPGLRRLPRRFPWFARYFDLAPPGDGPDPAAPSTGPSSGPRAPVA
jgi:hypothetical protein